MFICICAGTTNRFFQKLCCSSYFQKAEHPQNGYTLFCLTLSINIQTDPQFFVSVQDKTESPQQEKLFRTELTRGRQHCDEVSSSLSDVG